MKKDSDSARTRSRPRKKPAAPPLPAAPVFPLAPTGHKNVGSLEGTLSLFLGALLVLAALFPRSIKQLLLLGLGGGLVRRGMTGHCGLYQALGLDSARGSLLQQVNEKYLTAARG